MDQTRAARIASLQELSRKAFNIGGPLGDNLKQTFDLLHVVVRNGIDDERSVRYQLESFRNGRHHAQNYDNGAHMPLNSAVYELTKAVGTTIQSILDDRSAAAYPHVEEAASSPYNTSETSEEPLFLPFGIKQEPLEEDEVPAPFADVDQLQGYGQAQMRLHPQPRSTFDQQARFINGELSPLVSPRRIPKPSQVMRHQFDSDLEEEDDEMMVHNGRSASAAPPVARKRATEKAAAIRMNRMSAQPETPVAISTSSGAIKYPCQVCGKRFNTVSRLRCHATMMHKEVLRGKKVIAKAQPAAPPPPTAVAPRGFRPNAEPEMHACIQCGEAFTTEAGMKRHATRKHTAGGSGSSAPPSAMKQRGEFDCEHCDKNFGSVKGLAMHAWQHEAVHCTVCGTSMKQDRLAAHMKLKHANVIKAKPVSPIKEKVSARGKVLTVSESRAGFVHCHICSSRQPNPSALNCHLRTIHGLLPYECGECGASFGKKTEEVTHRKLVHGGK